MNIDKICHNFELCKATLKTIKKTLVYLDASKAPILDGISSKFWRDGAEASLLPLYYLVNLSLKQSFFPDQCKIAKLMPSPI